MTQEGHRPAALSGLSVLVVLVTMAVCSSATAQMTEREADSKIASMQTVVDTAALKRVLIADRSALARYVGSSDKQLAGYAVEEAHRRRDSALTPALAARLLDRRSGSLSALAAAALGAMTGEPRLSALRKGLQDPRAQVRAAAGLALAPSGDRTAIPALREALDQPDPDVRIAAASSLSIFHDRQSIPRILRLTGELNECDRRLVCNAIGRFRAPETERKLRRMLVQEPYAGTRAHAALALGAPGNRSAVPSLISALRDRCADVRLAAALALEEVGDRRAIPALKQASVSTAPDARNAFVTDRNARVVARDAAVALAHPSGRPGSWPIRVPTHRDLWQRSHSAGIRTRP